MRYIGKELRDRIDLLGIDVQTLAENTFMDVEILNTIIDDKLAFEDIDEFNFTLICSALHCNPLYFLDEKVKKQDLLIFSMNKKYDTVKIESSKSSYSGFSR